MEILTFNYTKADGKSSTRTVCVTQKPTNLLSGVDVSTLEVEDQVSYAMEADKAREAYMKALDSINAKYDVKHNYRQFKTENMSAVSADFV